MKVNPEKYKKIPVKTKENKIVYAYVDFYNYEKFMEYEWFLLGGFAVRKCGNSLPGKYTLISMHSQVCGVELDTRYYVSHRTGQKLNNLRVNLEIKTHRKPRSPKTGLLKKHPPGYVDSLTKK